MVTRRLLNAAQQSLFLLTAQKNVIPPKPVCHFLLSTKVELIRIENI